MTSMRALQPRDGWWPDGVQRAIARFDDLRTGRAMAFGPSATETLVANRAQDVIPVLRAVEDAALSGSWVVGFVAYEAAAGLDSALPVRAAQSDEPCGELPLAWFGVFPSAHDAGPLDGGLEMDGTYSHTPWEPAWDPDRYASRIGVVRERIAAGDTYQCNLTVRLHARVDGDTRGLYRDLALAQRGAYNAYLDTGRFVVASASPELFFDWGEDRLVMRPMKGTVRRGRWPGEDAERAQGLVRSVKDQAENVMIVDLLRNDLGKLAQWGSVEVTRLSELERFETLWQLTSTVSARPRPGTSLADIFEALFPCGSVTGAPKRRTMELIAGLEDSQRGVYCGAVGVVAPPESGYRARFNVAIRTVVVDRATGAAVYGTGGGITWGSTASAEIAESAAKAAILATPYEDFELVETMGYWPGAGLRNLDLHLERLRGTADYFGFVIDVARVRRALEDELAVARVSRRVRLTLSRSGSTTVSLSPMPPANQRAVVLALDTEPVDASSIWLYHKTSRRSIYEERVSRHPAADDVILTNERGEVTEATIANLCVRLDDRWWTPPIDSGCLPGVERRRLLEQGTVMERIVAIDDLYAADQIALVSSLRAWRPAVLLTSQEDS